MQYHYCPLQLLCTQPSRCWTRQTKRKDGCGRVREKERGAISSHANTQHNLTNTNRTNAHTDEEMLPKLTHFEHSHPISHYTPALHIINDMTCALLQQPTRHNTAVQYITATHNTHQRQTNQPITNNNRTKQRNQLQTSQHRPTHTATRTTKVTYEGERGTVGGNKGW